MRPSTYAGFALLVSCGAAFAQQPLALPGRSQSTGQQSVDNAACYAYANQTTKVVMAREPQTAPKNNAIETRTLGAPRPVEPPLPPVASGALAASAAPASGASATMAGRPAGASATVAAGASAPMSASGAAVAAGASGASGAVAASGASDANYAEMKMPPMPPPEPPMVRYWRAYGECMQNRGYYVR
ncbi:MULTISPECIES: hypothetical protein [unclassified Caballeronia]|uniref:hypothetical protein n=1 Tax=unclassified Caballeronia TaxID=2646786 RepID=UPI002028D090|nr:MULTISPECIES: hypothetical protein [unclassified Caballeronia]MDR5775479.1 hypothetical protein [Caballeronia sp. LZ002]MDR5850917.1 hypothetical protein [Caballeronia sp. LZ003]